MLRFVAYVVDWLVTVIVGSVLVSVGGLQLYFSSDRGQHDASDRSIYAFAIISALVVPVWLLMTLIGWAVAGSSIGKLATGLRVVDRRGRRPGLLRGGVRLLVYAVENLPLLAGVAVIWLWLVAGDELPRWALPVCGLLVAAALAALLPALLRSGGRPLHDLMAGTTVEE